MKTREIILKRRPAGWPTVEDFAIRESDTAAPQENEVLLETLWLSVDPYMRGRMNDRKSYVPPFRLEEAISGGGIGRVIESRDPGFEAGDVVLGNLRWRETDNVSAKQLRVLDPEVAPLPSHLGVLGMPGLTAFVGLRRIGNLVPSDTVFVSGAAGAVGLVVGQIAKLSGATVIGSAGSSTKVETLLSLGFDFAFNYKEQPVESALRDICRDSISLYYDNVGGDHLDAALANMADFGRIVMCGAVSQYNLEKPAPGPSHLPLAVARRLTLRGFIVSDHLDMQESFLAEATGWIRHGKLRYRETIWKGLENAPAAFIAMMQGENVGKMIVEVSPAV